jgi:N-acyl homoserine lactone hydrolase
VQDEQERTPNMTIGTPMLPENISILFFGFPGKCTRGYLGWSTVALIDIGKKILFDTGNWGDRYELISRLDREGLRPSDIQTVILSHTHFDHAGNMSLFKNADIVLSNKALNYVCQNTGDLLVPEFMSDYLESISERLILVKNFVELQKNIVVIETPGHTPESISCLITHHGLRIMLTGDAIKNAYEYVSGVNEAHYDRQTSQQTIMKIKGMADIIIPGHDRPFSAKNGKISYLSESEDKLMIRANPYDDEWTTFSIGTARF